MDFTDAARVLDELFAQTGQRLDLVGLPALGDTGTWRSSAIAEVLEYVRGRGLPLPRYELIVELAECTLIVQERLPGEPTPSHLDETMLTAVLAMVESFRGLLDGWLDVPHLELVLEGPGTDSLARYSDRSRRLLDWIRSVGARRPRIAGDDLVHYDFHLDNLLFRGGVLTGIVDWHEERNLRRGDTRCASRVRRDLNGGARSEHS